MPPGDPSSGRPGPQAAPRLATLVAVTGIAAAPMNMFLPSLPEMAREFGTDYRVMQLSIGLYLGVMAATQIVLGPLSDRFGRRRVLIGAYGVFTLASVACIFATSSSAFLLCRMAQAVVYGGVVLSRAIVRDTSEGADAARKMSFVTMGMAMVPMAAPALGGLLDAAFGWRAVFAVFAASGVLGIVLIHRGIPSGTNRRTETFADQMRATPKLLRSGVFWAYTLAGTFSAATYFVFLGGAAYVGAEVFRLSPERLGLYFGTTSLGYVVGSFLSAQLAARLDIDRMILLGTCLGAGAAGLSLGLIALGLGSAESFFGLTIGVGIGYGLALPSANLGLLSVAPSLAGTASGVGAAIMIGLGSALSALSGAWVAALSSAAPLLLLQIGAAMAGAAAILVLRRPARSFRQSRK